MINFEAMHTSILGEQMRCVELFENEEITEDRSTNQEVFLNEFIDVDSYRNYHTTRIGMYVIFDKDQPISKVLKDLQDIEKQK